MLTASAFRELDKIPSSMEEVLWPDLEPGFYQQCREGLEMLTAACKSAQRRTSFYPGAGISVYRPSRLPVAYTVIQALFEECVDIYPALKRYSPNLNQALGQSHYVLMENIFQHLYESVPPDSFHAGHVFDIPFSPSRFNVNHAFLARWLHSNRGTVVTPNLDPLIEHAWQYATGIDPSQLRVIRRPDEFRDWDRLVSQPDVLWKLHGSSDDSESWAIILSRVGFDLKDARSDFIKYLVSQQNVCFVGYRAADLDLFPPLLEAHTQRKKGGGVLFWAFYFSEKHKTLGDYLQNEPNIARLFETNSECIYPIVTTAERLSTWLQSQCLGIEPELPSDMLLPEYDYRRWFAVDLKAIGEQAAQNLIGYTFRVLGEYDQAMIVLDEAVESVSKNEAHFTKADELLIQRTAQLLQESAHTSWQKEDYSAAISKVKRAQRLLKKIGDDVDVEFGVISMILDAKGSVTWLDKVSAIARLIKLHARFSARSHRSSSGFSPVVGQGLCTYYEAKIAETVFKKTPLIRIRGVVLFLTRWYGRAGSLFEKGQFLNSIPDIKRRQAFLWVTLDEHKAVQDMIDSIRIAQTVSQAHHQLSLERAGLLLDQIKHPEARSKLLEAINRKK